MNSNSLISKNDFVIQAGHKQDFLEKKRHFPILPARFQAGKTQYAKHPDLGIADSRIKGFRIFLFAIIFVFMATAYSCGKKEEDAAQSQTPEPAASQQTQNQAPTPAATGQQAQKIPSEQNSGQGETGDSPQPPPQIAEPSGAEDSPYVVKHIDEDMPLDQGIVIKGGTDVYLYKSTGGFYKFVLAKNWTAPNGMVFQGGTEFSQYENGAIKKVTLAEDFMTPTGKVLKAGETMILYPNGVAKEFTLTDNINIENGMVLKAGEKIENYENQVAKTAILAEDWTAPDGSVIPAGTRVRFTPEGEFSGTKEG